MNVVIDYDHYRLQQVVYNQKEHELFVNYISNLILQSRELQETLADERAAQELVSSVIMINDALIENCRAIIGRWMN